MNDKLKELLKKNFFVKNYVNFRNKKRKTREFYDWIENKDSKSMSSPHIVKQKVLRAYAKKYDLKILVETGTYLGEMLEALQDYFDCLYSIELSKSLYEKAISKFSKIDKVKLCHGDRGIVINKIVDKLESPALFWLDGHYSAGITAKGEKDTPILEEIDCILSVKEYKHVIIIDDARCFGESPDYPTLNYLTEYVLKRRPHAQIIVKEDMIRIV